MLKTSARILNLLSLLQERREWSGAGLADRMGVTTRTVRNDVERLRDLGYPVESTSGVGGGYRLGRGAEMPPLLLDDEEAIAVAVGLRTAASGSVSGIEQTLLRALTKLEQVLPSKLRHRISTMQTYTVPVPSHGPTIDPSKLTFLATACREMECIRFDYVGHGRGDTEARHVEPYRVVYTRNRWYLVAWDIDRDDWRTFRVDRLEPKLNTGPTFKPRQLPHDDIGAYVSSGVAQALWTYQAKIKLSASFEEANARVPQFAGSLEPIDAHSCLFSPGSDELGTLALYLGMTGFDFEVIEPPELIDHVRTLAERFGRAAG